MPEVTKLCPGCGVANVPNRAFCWRCDADLSAVAPTPIARLSWKTASEPTPRASALARAWAEVSATLPAKPSATPLLVLAGLAVTFAGCFVLNNIINTTKPANVGLGGGMTLPAPPSLPAADSTDAAPAVAADPFGVPPGTKARYRVVELQPIDLGDVTRTRVRITVPAGLSRSEMDATIRHALKTFYGMRPVDGLALFVYRDGTDVHTTDTVAKALFVPDGDWMRTAHGTPLSQFKAKIDVEDGYFRGPAVTASATSAPDHGLGGAAR
jgi:hypothetical protein